jgi:hypothetical protein
MWKTSGEAKDERIIVIEKPHHAELLKILQRKV